MSTRASAGRPAISTRATTARARCSARDLEAVLAGVGADALLLTGLSVNNAISSTARDAFARDLPAVVVKDLVGAAPWEPAEKHETYFEILSTWTAEVAGSADVLDRLQSR